jgi:hypothetical protein
LVHPQNVQLHNVQLQNVQLQNVHLQNVQLQNVQVTKRPGYQTSILQNVQITKRPGHKTSSFCKFKNLYKNTFFHKICQKLHTCEERIGDTLNGQHQAGSTAAIRLPIGYRRLNLTYPDTKSAHTHGPHHARTAQRIGVMSS